MMSDRPLRRVVARYAELLSVIATAAVGLVASGPGQAFARVDAVNVVLVVLVFSAALTVPAGLGTRLRRDGTRSLAVTALSSRLQSAAVTGSTRSRTLPDVEDPNSLGGRRRRHHPDQGHATD